MNLAAARELAESDPKIKAVVETAPDLPLRDSESADFQLFSLVRDATARFKELCEQREADGWIATLGNRARGMIVFERGDELFAVSLDKRSAHVPSKG